MSEPLPSYDLSRVEKAGLLINEESPEETVTAALMLVKAAEERLAEIKRMVKAGAVEWIQANHEIVIGATRYYAGHKTAKWTEDNAGVLGAVLDAMGGDINAAAQYLGSNAWKPGGCRKLLADEVYWRLFKEKKRTTLKEGTPLKKQLLTARVEVS
jgi:predicted ATPase